ncbi:MAG: PspC domain-containing protein [Acidobacteriia bacterium]|nr:PspC domain-containing protein [Terriglobia bacterium]
MYCNACGKAIPDDARLCPYCAKPVPGTAPVTHQLLRPRQGRMIAGVCAGLAQHFGWSLTLLRLVWLLLFIFAGAGGLLYIIFWIVIPNE